MTARPASQPANHRAWQTDRQSYAYRCREIQADKYSDRQKDREIHRQIDTCEVSVLCAISWLPWRHTYISIYLSFYVCTYLSIKLSIKCSQNIYLSINLYMSMDVLICLSGWMDLSHRAGASGRLGGSDWPVCSGRQIWASLAKQASLVGQYGLVRQAQRAHLPGLAGRAWLMCPVWPDGSGRLSRSGWMG
jgi:hypothetical protein